MTPSAGTVTLEDRLRRLERRTARLAVLLMATLMLSLVLASALLALGAFRANSQDRINEGIRDRLDRLERSQPPLHPARV